MGHDLHRANYILLVNTTLILATTTIQVVTVSLIIYITQPVNVAKTSAYSMLISSARPLSRS